MSKGQPPKTNQQAAKSARGANVLLERLSRQVTEWVGSSWAFAVALAMIAIWGATGPLFNFNETWQLIINTGTTIVTFLMVVLIQRSQNKEALAVEIKLNELLAAQRGASNALINAEDLSEEEIRQLHEDFASLAKQLQSAADDGPHSIAEVHRAVRSLHQSLSRDSSN